VGLFILPRTCRKLAFEKG